MITVTTVLTRPSDTVEFFIGAHPDIKAAFWMFLSTTQHLAAPPEFSQSEDGLVNTSIATFVDQAQYDAFLAELEQAVPGFFTLRDQYCQQHGILVDKTITTV